MNPTPKQEAEALMQAALPFAQKMLREHGEFFPYGAALLPDGKIGSVAAQPDNNQRPTSKEIIDLLSDAFRAGAAKGNYRATAIVANIVAVPPGKTERSDAIVVQLDHVSGYSVSVVFPYVRAANGELTLSAPFATQGRGDIFVATTH